MSPKLLRMLLEVRADQRAYPSGFNDPREQPLAYLRRAAWVRYSLLVAA